MIRILFIFAFALFANSVSAKMHVVEAKKISFHLDQFLIQTDDNLLADDSGDDDIELLKKCSEISFSGFHTVIFRYDEFVHVVTVKRVESKRSVLSRICVLRL